MAIMASRLQRAVSLARVFSTASSAFTTRSSSPLLVEKMVGSAYLIGHLCCHFVSWVLVSSVIWRRKRSTLFEGTDYNHRFVTMEFPDPQPGVTWVLPDSYVDPKTKTYGGTGDRYIMGVLKPNPNATSYNRPSGRYNERTMNRRRDSLPLL